MESGTGHGAAEIQRPQESFLTTAQQPGRWLHSDGGDYPYGHMGPNSKFDNVNLGYQFLEVELRLISVTINFWKFWSLMELSMDVTHSGGLSWLAMSIHRSWFRWVLP